MKFAIGSDFHLDINQDYPFELTAEKDAFYLCCGDISGEPDFRDKWLEEQAKHGYHGAFVLGNHQMYHEEEKSIQDMHSELRERLQDHQQGFRFLENDSIYFPEENILLIGCTLWTDFNQRGFAQLDGKIAEQFMNDYRWHCFKDGDQLRKLNWQDTVDFHCESVSYIRQTIDEYKHAHPGLKVVIMTHHAPSDKSIGVVYLHQALSAAFASSMDGFIRERPEIKLWVHGHLHEPSDYDIGECRVICNPRGYNFDGDFNKFDPNLIVEI